MKIDDHLVQLFLAEEYETTVLSRSTIPVNLRLYKKNHQYKEIILQIVKYMDEHLNSNFDDWKDPIGVAANNLGFSFSIIGYKLSTTTTAKHQFCLNPKITCYSGVPVSSQGNCGSLKLKEAISIERYSQIDFEYYDLEGNLVQKRNIGRHEGGFTIQNEIDQINGVSVIDRAKRSVKPEHFKPDPNPLNLL